MFVALLLALAAETTAPTAATPPPSPAAPVATAPATTPAKAGEEMVCRTEQVVGTRFAKKICRSKADIAQRRQDDQDRVRKNQRPGGLNGS